jgi:acyl-CoA synthetase (AMP-forming)/AMP-acid ligase II
MVTNNAEVTKSAHSYLHINDPGHIDEHGHLRIADRMKHVIKTRGGWILSLEVADILS